MIGLVAIGILSGSVGAGSLWFYDPVVALLCAPLAASAGTALSASLRLFGTSSVSPEPLLFS